jgi:hypothetical protein
MMISAAGAPESKIVLPLIRLYSLHQFSISTWASSSVVKIAPLTLEGRISVPVRTDVAPV